MKFRRSKQREPQRPPAGAGPHHNEPGLYECKACGYYFINFGNDRWQGPLYACPTQQRPEQINNGQILTWEQIDDRYGDCTSRLVSRS